MLWSIGKSFLDQAIKKDLKAYDNKRKIATGQRDNYTSGCLLNYPYFKKNYKLIAIDLNKQQKLDADPKAIQQINKLIQQVFHYWRNGRKSFGLFKRNS